MTYAPSVGLTLAMGIAWIPLCTISLILRFLARKVRRMDIKADDWLLIPALLLTIGLGVVMIYGVQTQAFAYPTPPVQPGVNPLDSTNAILQINRELFFIFPLIQVAGLWFVKMSFLAFYLRVFCDKGSSPMFKKVIIACAVFMTIWTATLWFVRLFSCGVHFSAYWHSQRTALTQCINFLQWVNAFGSSDFIQDLIIFFLPLPSIFKLNMKTMQKIGVVIAFSFGAVSTAASGVRMVIFINAVHDDFKEKTDEDLLITNALYWSMLESGLGLLSANLPVLHGLVRTRFTQKLGYSVGSKYANAANRFSFRPGDKHDVMSVTETPLKQNSVQRPDSDDNASLNGMRTYYDDRNSVFELQAAHGIPEVVNSSAIGQKTSKSSSETLDRPESRTHQYESGENFAYPGAGKSHHYGMKTWVARASSEDLNPAPRRSSPGGMGIRVTHTVEVHDDPRSP